MMVEKCAQCGTIVIVTTCDLCGKSTCKDCATLEVKSDTLVVRHSMCKRKRVKKVIE